MTLILIRHGETPLNATRTLQPPGTPLSERGIRQADAVARRLAGLGLAGIVSSDLPRARLTAQAISRACGLTMQSTPLLQERNFGDWRGRPYDALAVDPLTMDGAPPGGESAAAFHDRVAQAFAHALSLRSALGGDLAVVTHGLVIRAMLTRLARLPEGAADAMRCGNTSVSIVDAEPPHEVVLLDCTRHLDALTQHDAGSLSGG